MPQFLVAIHHPSDFDASVEDAEMHQAIDDLNDEMVKAGIRTFVGGLQPIKSARSVRRESSGRLSVTDGPYLETREYVGGFWVLQCASMEEALEWGRKAAVACQAPVEVRQFN